MQPDIFKYWWSKSKNRNLRLFNHWNSLEIIYIIIVYIAKYLQYDDFYKSSLSWVKIVLYSQSPNRASKTYKSLIDWLQCIFSNTMRISPLELERALCSCHDCSIGNGGCHYQRWFTAIISLRGLISRFTNSGGEFSGVCPLFYADKLCGIFHPVSVTLPTVYCKALFRVEIG